MADVFQQVEAIAALKTFRLTVAFAARSWQRNALVAYLLCSDSDTPFTTTGARSICVPNSHISQ